MRPQVRYVYAAVVLTAAALAGQALGQGVIFDNGGLGCTGALSSQLDTSYPFNSQTAESFTLLPGANVITGAHWWGTWFNPGPPGNATAFKVLIYADAGGHPTGAGLSDPSSTALKTWTVTQVHETADACCPGYFSYSANLASNGGPFTGTPGTRYWIVFQSVSVYPPQWGWATTAATSGDAVLGFPLVSVPYWTAQNLTMAFYLTGPAGPPLGACCFANPTCCEDLSQASCAGRGGTWYGGVSCSAVQCAALGACCLPGGCCQDLPQAVCASQGGTWHAGTNCGAFQCPLPPWVCTFQACCDLLVSNPNPLPGQTTTVVLRGGVNPTNMPCGWYGIGDMGGNFSSTGTTGIGAGAITGQALIGYFGANTGNVGSVSANPLAIASMDCLRACNPNGPGSIFGGCPLNNSAQDIYRFDFTVPANALPGTTYSFTYTGNAHGITLWCNNGFNIYCPMLSPALPVGPCTVTITVGGTPTNDSCGNCIPLTPGTPVQGTTVGATTDGTSSCGGTDDVWYCFTPTCPQPITIDTCQSPPNTDTVLSVHTACPGTVANEVVCNDDVLPGSPCFPSLQSQVTFTPVPNQTYYIRVATLPPPGPFTILLTQPPAPPPANDLCTAAVTVTNGTTPFSTCGATATGPAGCTMYHDIWFRYVATCTGTISIGLCGSQFDTMLAVYCGSCSNPVQVRCNDDNGPLCGGTSSSAVFFGTAGTAYLIRVGGKTPASFGSGQLFIACTPGAPPNDTCAFATPIPSLPATLTGTTIGATPTPLLPGICGLSQHSPDVYYTFSTCSYGPVTINTCGTPACASGPYDTVLSVHTACPDSTSNYTVACNDDAGPGSPCYGTYQSSLTFNPVPCQQYLVRVAGFGGAIGNFQLNVSQAVQPPPNNPCASATVVTTGTTTPFSTCGATTDGVGSPCNLANDVWFKWTASCSGSVTIDTCGSSFDTVLSVYASTACPPPANSLVACNDDALLGPNCWWSSQVTFNAVAGTTYVIRVGGYLGATGCGKLTIHGPSVTCPTCPPTTGGYCPPPKYYVIVGTADGHPWKWQFKQDACCTPQCLACGPTGGGFCIQDCNVPGVAAGSSPAVLAAAFVASINAACPPSGSTLLATAVGGGAFQVKFRCCPANTNPVRLYVGHDTTPCNTLCLVTTATLATAGPCSFNPMIVELETSGQDCNGNGIDDLVDIALGYSLDANSNGIPDECEPALLGDMNCDGRVDFNDINPFVLYLSDFKTWQATYPDCPPTNGDCNGDGEYPSFGDINAFVALLSQ